MDRHLIRNGKASLDRVVGMEAHVPRISGGRLHAPTASWGELNSSGRTQCLRNRIFVELHSICAQVFRDSSEAKSLGNPMFETDVRRSVIVLRDHRIEVLVQGSPSSYQSSFSPRPSHAKIDCGREIPRMQLA